MTPIPDDVAAAIVAAGHYLRAEAAGVWTWTDGDAMRPLWEVTTGERPGYQTVTVRSVEATPRAALMRALSSLARVRDGVAADLRKSATRRRDPSRKARDTRNADAEAQRAAEVRALVARVAEMWPEVTL